MEQWLMVRDHTESRIHLPFTKRHFQQSYDGQSYEAFPLYSLAMSSSSSQLFSLPDPEVRIVADLSFSFIEPFQTCTERYHYYQGYQIDTCIDMDYTVRNPPLNQASQLIVVV